MEITPTSAAAAATTKAQEPSGEAADAANELAGDFETFLSLLTAQLRNQDPLKPMESTEFVAQLASFSAVEQQVRTNDRLDELAKSDRLESRRVAGLRDVVERALAERADALERRRVEGRVVEGHGDLHLDHVWFETDVELAFAHPLASGQEDHFHFHEADNGGAHMVKIFDPIGFLGLLSAEFSRRSRDVSIARVITTIS